MSTHCAVFLHVDTSEPRRGTIMSFRRLIRRDDLQIKIKNFLQDKDDIQHHYSCTISIVYSLALLSARVHATTPHVSASPHNLSDPDIPSSTLTPLLTLMPHPSKLRSRVLDLVNEQRPRRTLTTTATCMLE